MDIGTIIAKYCDEHGMSSTEFANRVGVSRAYIYMLAKKHDFMRNFHTHVGCMLTKNGGFFCPRLCLTHI